MEKSAPVHKWRAFSPDTFFPPFCCHFFRSSVRVEDLRRCMLFASRYWFSLPIGEQLELPRRKRGRTRRGARAKSFQLSARARRRANTQFICLCPDTLLLIRRRHTLIDFFFPVFSRFFRFLLIKWGILFFDIFIRFLGGRWGGIVRWIWSLYFY